MQSRLLIDKKALDANARALREHVRVPVIAVVKMNGYGITIRHAVDAWYAAGVRMFAVAEPVEAAEALSLGYEDIDVLLMSPVLDEAVLDALLERGTVLTVGSPAGAALAARAGERKGVRPRVHVKINTGFGRFGLEPEDIDGLRAVYATDGLQFEGIFSHFAASFEKEYDVTKTQLERFKSVLARLDAEGVAYGIAHMANSCAAIRFPETRLDAVRVGSALVGRQANPRGLSLQKIGVLEADIVDVRTFRPGDTAGYAMLFRAKKEMTAAVTAVGHQTGYGLAYREYAARWIDVARTVRQALRGYKKPLTVTCKGRRIPLIGRVGHQYTLFDVSGMDAAPGDTVEAEANILLVDSSIERKLI